MFKHEKVRQLIKEQGRTTDWLARQVGLDIKSLRNVLRGRKPSLPVIKLLAMALNCSEADIYSDADNSKAVGS